MTLDELNISSECREMLKNTGFSMVDEIVEFMERLVVDPSTFPARTVKLGCFREVKKELQSVGLWTAPKFLDVDE